MRKYKIRKSLCMLLVLTLLTVLSSGCGRSEAKYTADGKKQIITIGYLPITHALAVFEEKELLDADENSTLQIQLQKFSSWTDLNLKAVALGHKDGNVVIVSNDITKVEDLKGKTFAIPSNQSSHNILLNDMLSDAGMSIDDVNVVQLAPAEMPSSLASGAIDGYCVAEPFGAQAVVQDYGHVLYDSTQLWQNSICCALVMNGSFLEKNKEAVDKLVAGYEEAGNRLDETTAKTLAEAYLGQNEKTLEVSMQWIHYDNLQITKSDYEQLTERMKKYGINKNPPSYEDFVYQPESSESD